MQSASEFFCHPEWLGNLDSWAGVVEHMEYRKHLTTYFSCNLILIQRNKFLIGLQISGLASCSNPVTPKN